MQASSAAEIPLLRRAAWVEEGVVKLDRGADADPVVGRFVRGLVLADLPERFGKAKQAVTDLEASLAARSRLPIDIDRQVYRDIDVSPAK